MFLDINADKYKAKITKINRFSVRKRNLPTKFYYSDDEAIAFDPNPVVSRGLTLNAAESLVEDLNRRL